MTPAGLGAFDGRDPARQSVHSYEATLRRLDAPHEKGFRANARAWAFFGAQPAGYRILASCWVMSARMEVTRSRRLAILIGDSAQGQRPPQVTGTARRDAGREHFRSTAPTK
ncbi:MAG: YdeI/OmpD-associated family protein [Chloroflexota bacterium]|nr:YdeI/OmpD-associated family protein [Chloroflexota bacterium]